MLPLWLSLNFGYRYYAHHLHEKTGTIYRDHAYMMGVAAGKHAIDNCHATSTRSCGAALSLVEPSAADKSAAGEAVADDAVLLAV
jgi:hypothetical protein